MKKDKQYAKALKNIKPGGKHVMCADKSVKKTGKTPTRDPVTSTLLELDGHWKLTPRITRADDTGAPCIFIGTEFIARLSLDDLAHIAAQAISYLGEGYKTQRDHLADHMKDL